MDQAIKRKWIKALRSGKYRQIKDALEYKGGYCCLGVLRDVAKTGGDSSGWLIPHELERVGLSEDEQSTLADCNDALVPFDMIAGLIDEAL